MRYENDSTSWNNKRQQKIWSDIYSPHRTYYRLTFARTLDRTSYGFIMIRSPYYRHPDQKETYRVIRLLYSARGAYSQLASRVPGSSSERLGKARFQRPRECAFRCRSARKEGVVPCRLTWVCHSLLRGKIWLVKKSSTCSCNFLERSECSKFMMHLIGQFVDKRMIFGKGL